MLRSSGLVGTAVRATGIKKRYRELVDAGSDPDAIADLLKRRRRLDQPMPPAILGRRFDAKQVENQSFPLHVLVGRNRTAGSTSQRVILYFFGGGMVLGPSMVQWLAISSIAHRSDADLLVPDYPKAPEHSALDTLAAVADAWLYASDRYGPENVVLVGDSSGGNLALSLMVELAALGHPQPALALLISPAVDISLSNPAIEALAPLDQMLDREGVLRDLALWRGSIPPDDTRVSPGLASVEGLAPTHFYVGTHEILYPDVAAYVRRGQEAGAPMWITEAEGGQHVWPLFSTPSGSKARREMVNLIEGVFLGVS